MRRFAVPVRQDAERGASAVEFALLFPIFFMIVLGTINFGFTYERWIGITQGAREGSRFAATLGLTAAGATSADTTPWMDKVSDRMISASGLSVDPATATPGMTTCVALKIQPATSPTPTVLRHATISVSATGAITRAYNTGSCPGMTAPVAGNYVQARIEAPRDISWFLGGTSVTLRGASTSRFEATEA